MSMGKCQRCGKYAECSYRSVEFGKRFICQECFDRFMLLHEQQRHNQEMERQSRNNSYGGGSSNNDEGSCLQHIIAWVVFLGIIGGIVTYCSHDLESSNSKDSKDSTEVVHKDVSPNQEESIEQSQEEVATPQEEEQQTEEVVDTAGQMHISDF